jgi:hypothetical protein
MARMALTMLGSGAAGNGKPSDNHFQVHLIDRLRPVMFDMVEDIAQDLVGPLIGIDVRGELGSVKLKDGHGLFHVNFLAALNHFDINIIEPVLLEGATLEAVVDLGFVRALQMEDAADVEFIAEDLRLVDVAGNAIENEEIDVGFEASGLHHAIDLIGPKADRNIVRNQLAFARILQKSLAEIGADIDGAKNIAAGAMKKAGDGAENFTLGSFARTRSTKKKEGFIKHS